MAALAIRIRVRSDVAYFLNFLGRLQTGQRGSGQDRQTDGARGKVVSYCAFLPCRKPILVRWLRAPHFGRRRAPSPGPRRLVKAPAAGHPLPQGGEGWAPSHALVLNCGEVPKPNLRIHNLLSELLLAQRLGKLRELVYAHRDATQIHYRLDTDGVYA